MTESNHHDDYAIMATMLALLTVRQGGGLAFLLLGLLIASTSIGGEPSIVKEWFLFIGCLVTVTGVVILL